MAQLPSHCKCPSRKTKKKTKAQVQAEKYMDFPLYDEGGTSIARWFQAGGEVDAKIDAVSILLSSEHMDFSSSLVAQGCSVWTPLQYVCAVGNHEGAMVLLNAGASVDTLFNV